MTGSSDLRALPRAVSNNIRNYTCSVIGVASVVLEGKMLIPDAESKGWNISAIGVR